MRPNTDTGGTIRGGEVGLEGGEGRNANYKVVEA